MKRALAILGSARSDGNSAFVIKRLVEGLPCDLIDLHATSIAPFSYDQRYPQSDPFLPIIERMTRARVTLFVTPVYWSSYSAVMKGFLDRFFDITNSERGFKESLRGCSFALVASGSDPQLDSALTLAFSEFCDALGARCIAFVYAREKGEFTSPETVDLLRREIGAN